MVVIEISATLEGLQFLQDKLKSLSMLLKKIALHFESETRKALEKGEGRATDWPDLSEKTKKQKIKAKGTAYPILTFTGRLRNSINSSVSNTEAQIFSGVKYGVFHQLGTSKMPARPFMEVTDQDLEAVLEAIIEHFGGEQ